MVDWQRAQEPRQQIDVLPVPAYSGLAVQLA